MAHDGSHHRTCDPSHDLSGAGLEEAGASSRVFDSGVGDHSDGVGVAIVRCGSRCSDLDNQYE